MKFRHHTVLGKILKRYKRFLSDILLENGEMVHAHVPNTGSMKTCWEPGQKVLLTHVDDSKRKLKYTLEMTYNGESWICVNTAMTNKLVHEALEKDVIEELIGYKTIKAEQKILDSRIDFYLSDHPKNENCYVEVKNVTLKGKDRIALFPDAVSIRGQKHLKDLMQIKQQGLRAVMLYVINREDTRAFAPADEIDPTYADLLREAASKGVEVLAYQSKLNENEIILQKQLKVIL